MKSHELARKLLELPDAEVLLICSDEDTGLISSDPSYRPSHNYIYIYSD